MKVYCIRGIVDRIGSGDKFQHITAGKIYEVLKYTTSGVLTKDVFDDAWYITNDIGKKDWYNKGYFKSIESVRQEKLEELGI